MRRPDRDIWQATIDKELNMFISMNIFREETLPPGRVAIGSTWVFEFILLPTSPRDVSVLVDTCRFLTLITRRPSLL